MGQENDKQRTTQAGVADYPSFPQIHDSAKDGQDCRYDHALKGAKAIGSVGSAPTDPAAQSSKSI
jgi:hypothetical protein